MRPRHLFSVAALTVGALLAPTLPAVAAPVAPAVVQTAAVQSVVAPAAKKVSGKVTIKKIGTKTVAKGKKVTVKPSYKRSGTVKIVSARLTVTKGGKSVAKNKSSVKLAAGSYKVKQKVSYKVRSGTGWSKTRSVQLTQTLRVKVAAPKLTRTQKNAQAMAKNYLDFMSFSRMGLIAQLRYEGFSKSTATWAVDSLKANWNKQAAEMAESYLAIMPFSRSGLIEQLEYDGFTASQARYGVNGAGL